MKKLLILSALTIAAVSTSSAVVLVSNLNNAPRGTIQSVNEPFYQEFTVGPGVFDIDSITLNAQSGGFFASAFMLTVESLSNLGSPIGSFSSPTFTSQSDVVHVASGVTLPTGDYRLTIDGGGVGLLTTTTNLSESGLAGFSIADSYDFQSGGQTNAGQAIAFSLDGTQQVVPEPSAAGALLGLATVALVGMRRRVK